MKDQLIEFETAKLAKEKGFNIPVDKIRCGYNRDKEVHTSSMEGRFVDWNSKKLDNAYSAPTQSLLQKWLREEKQCILYCEITMSDYENNYWEFVILYEKNDIDYSTGSSKVYKNYEEALEKGLQEALKLI